METIPDVTACRVTNDLIKELHHAFDNPARCSDSDVARSLADMGLQPQLGTRSKQWTGPVTDHPYRPDSHAPNLNSLKSPRPGPAGRGLG